MTLTNETFEALLRRAREVAAQVLHSAEQMTSEADQVLSVSRGFGMTMDAGTADAWLLACGTVLYNASTEREELKEEA